MKAFWWSAGSDGCAWYRMHLPAIALAARGHHTHAAAQFTDRWDDADVIVGQRISNPGPSSRWQQWAAEGRRLVFDCDDHYFAFDQSNSAAFEFFNRPGVRSRLHDNIAAASVVTCATPRLAEAMHEHNPNVVVVPNGLPGAVLDWPAREPQGRLVIGWAGSPSTVAELPLVAEMLARLADGWGATADVELHLVGIGKATALQYGLGNHARVTSWIPHSMDYLRAIDFDIWLAPYRPTAFNEAKFPTKALESAFLGIPLIASDVAGYRGFVRHGETGLLVRKPHEWATHLRRLVVDDGLRTRMGKAAREHAQSHTIDSYAPLWEKVLAG